MLLTGKCLCGAVKYECEAEPESMQYCHCDTCRRVTGSAFNSYNQEHLTEFLPHFKIYRCPDSLPSKGGSE